MSGKKISMRGAIASAFLLVMIAVVIEILSSAGRIQNFIIPAPSAVFIALHTNFSNILPHLAATTWICAAGLALSIAAGFLIALVMDRVRVIKEVLYPLIIA
ncbi:hypothetical protein EOM86_13425, partial [Candidatus Nomurabacteria bacterium]|nr:hypothetical protein [Candidatus Nomurabacteria bacterium]